MSVTEDTVFVGTGGVEQPFTTGALGFTPTHLFISIEDQNIRFWYGGTVPTITTGHPGYATTTLTFNKTANIENLQMIAMAGTAKVNYTVDDS